MAVWTASTRNTVSKTTKNKHNLFEESFPGFGRALFLFALGFGDSIEGECRSLELGRRNRWPAPVRARSPEEIGNLKAPAPMSTAPSKLRAENVGRTPAKPPLPGEAMEIGSNGVFPVYGSSPSLGFCGWSLGLL